VDGKETQESFKLSVHHWRNPKSCLGGQRDSTPDTRRSAPEIPESLGDAAGREKQQKERLDMAKDNQVQT
jgi:hypothetical protein